MGSEGISVIGGLQMFELTVHWSLSFDPVLCSILHPRDVSRADSDHISIITGFFRFIRTVAISFNDSITNKFPSIKGSASFSRTLRANPLLQTHHNKFLFTKTEQRASNTPFFTTFSS